MRTEQEQELFDLAETMSEHLDNFGCESVNEYNQMIRDIKVEVENRES